MSDTDPTEDSSDEASTDDKLAELIEQVNNDHGSEGAGSMADHLRDQVTETEREDEDGGDTED